MRPNLESGEQQRALLVTGAVTLLLLLPVPAALSAFARGELFELGKDKLAHFGLFVLLAWVWLWALGLRGAPAEPSGRSPVSARGAALFAVLVAWGGAVELAQGWSGWRRGEWSDLAADALGALLPFVWYASRGGGTRASPLRV